MTVLAAILTILAGLIGLVWTSRHIKISRENKNGFLLSEDYAGPPEPAPRVSILVAGKDEEENIEACVRSLARQDYPDYEIIVCNDRSEDRTGEIVDRLAAEDSRIRVVHVTDLPEGWKGKNNAMRMGMQYATGEYLFFTDADCFQNSARTLSVAMQLIRDRNAGMLSILPTLEMKGFWENVIQPICGGVMMIWFEPDKVNNPDKPNSYANGAFMLMQRDVYDQIGGHEAVKAALQEDLEFAQKVKSQGLGLTVTRSSGLYKVRMYTSPKQIFRGWQRIFYGSFVTLRRLVASLVLMSMMGLYPYFAAAAGFILAGSGVDPQGWWWALGIAASAACLMQLSVIFRYYALTEANRRLFWTYPLGSLIVAGILSSSLFKHGKGAQVTWKGTAYPGRQKSPG